MRCLHCCTAATSKGRDMSLATFNYVLEAAAEYGTEVVTFGGGEPLLHPLFWTFVEMTLAESLDIFLITNGKCKQRALAVAAMAKKGVLGAELSRDRFHGRIDPCVVKAFTRLKPGTSLPGTALAQLVPEDLYDRRGIRDVTIGDTLEPVRQGRWKQGHRLTCLCDGDPYVKVDGHVCQCGCSGSPCVGSVRKGFCSLYPDEDQDGDPWQCYRTLKPSKVELEVRHRFAREFAEV